jgi:signal transduction histidine kinase
MRRGDSEAARSRRILIVDDDVDFADSLVDILAPHGYEIAIADRPETALAALERAAPAVALLDVRLKLSSGVDLLSRLTAQAPGLICVMMTAHADTQTAIKALRNGAYDYFDKSFVPNELLAMLDRCFEKLQLEEAARAAHEALRRAKEEAEAASRAKSEFLATMSHELRTPLNAVIGFSEMMMGEIHGPLGGERYSGYAQDIYNSGRHLLDIINDILDLSKAEAGKLDLVESIVDAGATIENACRLVRPRAEAAGLTLATSLPHDLPQLRADERIFKQILLNLLSNAVKFTPARGHIEVTASANPQTGLIISVCDSGIGIAEEHVQKAFEPFGQVDSSLNRRHQGTGLGLPLAAAMMERHGGRLTLHTQLGIGTTVVVTFPRDRIVVASVVA